MGFSVRKSHPILGIFNSSLVDLSSPVNLSAWWNMGSILGVCLITQIVSGVFLSMHYCGCDAAAFSSVVHMSQDVNWGWALRFFHANGASLFFVCMYIHLGRGLYYGSYYMAEVWGIGVVLLVASMGTAFMGYVLVWGQMSYWGATVITNLLSAVPYVGVMLVEWVWGGFAVDNATLTRFFSFHFVLPFVLVALAACHLLFLHEVGSGDPMGVGSDSMKVWFDPYYSIKDFFGFLLVGSLLVLLCLSAPNIAGDPENYLPANCLVTPVHIKPEWYFLWAYAILRSVPNKLGGVVAMFAAIGVLMLFPFLTNGKRQPNTYGLIAQMSYWSFVCVFLALTWLGGCPVEWPYEMLGALMTCFYFVFILVLVTGRWAIWGGMWVSLFVLVSLSFNWG